MVRVINQNIRRFSFDQRHAIEHESVSSELFMG